MEAVNTTPPHRQWVILLSLAAIFTLPLLAAWGMYHYQPFEERGQLANGELVTPAQRLEVPNLLAADGAPVDDSLFRDKWTLLYHAQAGQAGQADTACDTECVALMDTLLRVRLAQNKSMRHVQRVLVAPTGTQVPAGLDEGLQVVKAEQWPLPAGSVYVVDPQGYLVMRYRPGFDPGGLLTDLQRLLRLSGKA